jgi:hypothetical protein
MRIKLVFSTETILIENLTDFPQVPRSGEWFCFVDFLSKEELLKILQTSQNHTGRGKVQSVEHHRDAVGYYAEVVVWCGD